MQWFYNMKLKAKLMTGFIMVAVIAAVIGTLGIQKIHQLEAADTKMYEKMTVPIGDIGEVATAFQRMRCNLLEMYTADSTERLNDQKKRADERDKEIEELSAKYEKSLFTDAGRKMFQEFRAEYKKFDEPEKKYQAYVLAGKRAEAHAMWNGELEKARKGVQDSIDKLHDSKLKLAKQTADDNVATANTATRLMLIIMAFGVLIAIGLGILISKIVMGQLGADPSDVGAVALKVGNGDCSVEIDTKELKDDSVMMAMKKMVDSVKALVSDAAMLSDAAIAGKLATRADASKHQGDFQKVVAGVNDTLDAVIGPLNVAAEYMDRISKGDVPPKITDSYNGDFNEIKNNLNVCIDAVSALVDDANILAKAAMEGKLNTRADASKHQGDFRKIVAGVNNTIDRLVGLLDVMPAPAMIIDRDFNVLYMNKLGADVGGRSQQQVTGSKCYDHFRTSDCKTDNITR